MQLKETVYTAITECRVSLNVTATRRNGRMIIFTELQTGKNRPLPSSKNPLFQNEAKCTNYLVEMNFICVRITNHFHIQGWALNLVLIERPQGNSEMAYEILLLVTHFAGLPRCKNLWTFFFVSQFLFFWVLYWVVFFAFFVVRHLWV